MTSHELGTSLKDDDLSATLGNLSGAPAAAPIRVTPRTRRLMPLLLLLMAALAAFLLWHFALHGTEQSALAARDVPYLDGKWIRYSQGFAKRADLEFASAELSSLSPLLHVTGTVTFDPDRVAAIGARIAGRVRKVRILEGQQVKPGDVLAEIESATLGEAQATLIAASAHADAASANDRRERELAEAKISSHREAELASAVAAAARADLQAAQQRIKAMGGSAHGEAGVLLLESPIAGRVVERNLSRGQFVEPTLTAFRVADLRRVWVQLAVFERDLSAIRVGDLVELLPQGNGGLPARGSVAHVGDLIDLDTKTAKVRVVVEQLETTLRPGQSVLAKIHTSAPIARALVLPRDAITSVDGKSTVFAAHDASAVEPRTVQLGNQDATRVEIAAGLTSGERVAVRGVFALKSEMFR